MSFQDQVIRALLDHVALLVGLAAVLYWGTPKVLPKALKLYFSNGGGDIIRAIVKSENATQTEHYKSHIEERFKAHEEQERQRFQEIEDEVFRPSRRRARRR